MSNSSNTLANWKLGEGKCKFTYFLYVWSNEDELNVFKYVIVSHLSLNRHTFFLAYVSITFFSPVRILHTYFEFCLTSLP
jgi:hypothetical protein